MSERVSGEEETVRQQLQESITRITSQHPPFTKFMYDKAALIDLVRKLALQVGQFKLASGKMSSYYLDCRKVTIDSAGAN